MSIFICISRLICLIVGFSACTGINKEVDKSIDVLEDVTEEVNYIECGEEVETLPPKKLSPRKRHKPGDHLILDKLMTTIKLASIA